MGGGHGHGEPFEVPHWTTHNNWQRSPHLVEHAKRLERLGLRDPWMRNYWPQFNPDNPRPYGIHWSRHMYNVMKPGIRPGLYVAAGIIFLEELYSKVYYGHTSWGGHWGEPAHDHHGHDGEGGEKDHH